MPLRKAELELLRHVSVEPDGALTEELARWFEARPRFAAFVATHRDKIRKKVRTAKDEDASASVRAELLTAYLLLADRRFGVTPEAFGAGNRGPDLTLTFRAGYRFNVEVTQLRRKPVAAADLDTRLRSVVLGKLRQLPSGMANVLVAVVTAMPAPAMSEADLATAMRHLGAQAERADNAFFTRHHFSGPRSFQAHYRRLSAVCVVDPAGGTAAYCANREARHVLPDEPAQAVRRCLEAFTASERRSADRA